MEFDPEKIIKHYQKKTLDKNSAKEKLLSIIENSESVGLRLESINVLEKLEIENDVDIYRVLENLLISDLSEKIRIASAQIIKRKFMDFLLVIIINILQLHLLTTLLHYGNCLLIS